MEFVDYIDLYCLILRKHECLCDFSLNGWTLVRLFDHLEVHLDQPVQVSQVFPVVVVVFNPL